MKSIKRKIIYIILSSVFLLFSAFFLIMNVFIPGHFANEAKEALKTEINYMNEDGSDYEWSFLSYNIKYIEENIPYELYGYGKDTLKARTAITKYCEENNTENGECYICKTDSSKYVFMTVSEGDSEDYSYIMYIDVNPVTEYMTSLNQIFFAVLIAVSAIMCIIGLYFGRTVENAQEKQRIFFQNASHELKTPLMSIQGYAEGIETGVLDAGDSARIILEESDRMTQLVEELLEISKIDMEQINLNKTLGDIRECLYDCLRMLELVSMRENIRITPCFSDSPVSAVYDETQMKKAFLNILMNGIRYAGSEILIFCHAEGGNAVIKIQDDGDGIAEEDIKHIFDRFYIGKTGNTGIGLALTKEIVRLHKGNIRAYNSETGAVFEIKLPS